jgi:crossover junction endodeoxyribonuclease RuvC
LAADAVRVLGIDPGSRITGYGIVERGGERGGERRGERGGERLIYVASGCIRTTPRGSARNSDESPADRLGVLYHAVDTLIATHGPSIVAIEQVFVARNAQSALKLGQARGAVLAAVVANRLQVAEYAARRVKQAVTGTGAGDKSQVQHMVRVLLNLNAMPTADAADALAVAICHLHATGVVAVPMRMRRRR